MSPHGRHHRVERLATQIPERNTEVLIIGSKRQVALVHVEDAVELKLEYRNFEKRFTQLNTQDSGTQQNQIIILLTLSGTMYGNPLADAARETASVGYFIVSKRFESK